MTVLVTAASRHGATREIAEAIGAELERNGVEAEVRPPEAVDDLAPYDRVVLGSAVYVGKWLQPALAFAEAHASELAARPTWLFSSGPVGEPPKPEPGKAVDVGELVARIGPREHRLFAGKIDRSVLGLSERTVLKVVRAKDGDYRDWDAIARWAAQIAAER